MRLLYLLTVLLPYVSLETYSAKDSTHYVAAVVEYSPVVDPKSQLTGPDEVLKNIRNYELLISKAKRQQADIIVFPEAGLTGFENSRTRAFYHQMPRPRDAVCPCLQPSQWDEPLRRLSCAARNNQIYVVCNLREQSGSKRHNTNLVFDRNGVVVSRYRKMHLFNEPGVQVSDDKDFGVFHTDFGVTFGVTICFDLLFRQPASELVHSHNIRHFAFSTGWFSELPFLTACQIQAAWAWSHNSVLLASGINIPKYGSTGSGIYAGRMGPIKTIFTDNTTTQILVAQVPKKLDITDDFCAARKNISNGETKKGGASFQHLFLLKDWLGSFSTQLLPLGDTEEETTLCHGKFCCHFNIRATLPVTGDADVLSPGTDTQPHRLLVWDGVRDFVGAATGGVQFCGVVACKDATDVTSCGKWIPADRYRKVHFSKLQIRGDFEANNTMILANTLNQDLLPLPADSFHLKEINKYNSTDNVKRLEMILMKKRDDIQTFAIYNRVFDRDGSNYTHTRPKSQFSKNNVTTIWQRMPNFSFTNTGSVNILKYFLRCLTLEHKALLEHVLQMQMLLCTSDLRFVMFSSCLVVMLNCA